MTVISQFNKLCNFFKFSLTAICLTVCFSSTASALDIDLAWDASSELSITGYKLYYQPNSRNISIEKNETIPVDVGDQTSATLTGLPDNQVYYFAVSAYDQMGNESPLSDVIANGWTPSLIAPEHGTNQEGSSYVTFVWDTAPSNYPVSYTLYYGTDPQLNSAVVPLAIPSPTKKNPLALLLALLAVTYLIFGQKRIKLNLVGATCLFFGLVATGCGGGGSGDGVSGGSANNPAAAPQTTVAVVAGKSDYHEVYDLAPATTYYWKVIAIDDDNPGLRYESDTFTFTN